MSSKCMTTILTCVSTSFERFTVTATFKATTKSLTFQSTTNGYTISLFRLRIRCL